MNLKNCNCGFSYRAHHCPNCNKKLEKRTVLRAAFEEGFLAGRGDGWVNNPELEVAWNESRSKGESK